VSSVLELPEARRYRAALEDRLPAKTLRHVESVTTFMASFAPDLGVTPPQIAAAGLLHDYCKPMKPAELLDEARRLGIAMRPAYEEAPGLLHGPVAAALCRQEFAIDDEAYEAIYWHTTGTPGLGRVGLALYVADFAEPLRGRPETAEARRILGDEGFLAALRYVAGVKLRYVRTKAAVDPITEEFAAWVQSPGCEAALT
jgi:HD superfamily phosphohydrolase YqeK